MKTTLIAAALIVAGLAAGQNVAGEYAASMPEIASGLLLRPDHTFEFYLTYGAADFTGKGTWRLDRGDVVLTSGAAGAPPFRLIRSARTPRPGIRVHVVAPNGRGVEHMEVSLSNGTDVPRARTSHDGLAEFESTGTPASVSIHVPVYDVNAGPYTIDGKHNEFWFEINGPAITEMPFEQERLKRTGGVLELQSARFGMSLRYRKQ